MKNSDFQKLQSAIDNYDKTLSMSNAAMLAKLDTYNSIKWEKIIPVYSNQIQGLQGAINNYNKAASITSTLANLDVYNSIKWEKIIPAYSNQIQRLQGAINNYNKAASITSTLANLDVYNSIKWEKIIPAYSNQIQRLQGAINNYSKLMRSMNSLSYSEVLLDALRTMEIPSSRLEDISTIDLEEIQPYFELEDVQTEIEHEALALQEQTNPNNIMMTLNDWATKVLDTPAKIKEKAPFVFLLIIIMGCFYKLALEPAIQDIIKENVLHVSEFTSNKPEENAKQVKSTLEKDFGMALSTVNKVRVTNRETPVFRSQQRISGVIDTIPCNKAVIIIEKKRNWSFIMYTNSLGEELNGWVFTGNLAK
ncbi:tetratricopeptide (TPR) repeat protein [Bacillus mycoides]